MNKRIYIDINNEIGKRSNIINPIIPYNVNDCVINHKRIGIDLCLAVSAMAKTYSVLVGNKEIINVCKDNDYIEPICTLYPGIDYDVENIHEYFGKLLSSSIKGIYLDLSRLFVFNPSLFKSIFSFSEKSNLPIMVEWDQIDDKNTFFKMIKEYRKLKIIILNVNWAFKKYIFEYMKTNKNLYICMNGFIYQNMIEDVCDAFSSKRLLFGSGYPYYDIGSLKAMLEYSNISEEEKDDISHKNAIKLFNISNVQKRKYSLLFDPISSAVDNGLNLKNTLGLDIIDSHTHFISENASLIDWFGGNKSIDKLLKSSRKIGVSKIITSPLDGLVYDGIVGNKAVDNAIKKYDFPIYGYVTCNPYYSEDMETALKKINEDKYLGVKLYHSKNNYPYDGKLYEQLLNNVQQSGKFFLLHGTPEEAESVLKKYPNLLILLAHATQNYLFMDKVLGLQSKYSNLYIDICNRYMTYRALEYLVANGDSTRIIFGSDSNLLSQAAHVGWLAYSNISYDDKKNIFSNNIKKLVKKGKCNI